jgi:hypothetical protein
MELHVKLCLSLLLVRSQVKRCLDLSGDNASLLKDLTEAIVSIDFATHQT